MADKVFTMRIDEELLEKVRLSAERNKRSLAKEIEYVLDFHYNEGTPITMPDNIATKFIEILRCSPEFLALEKKSKELNKNE